MRIQAFLAKEIAACVTQTPVAVTALGATLPSRLCKPERSEQDLFSSATSPGLLERNMQGALRNARAACNLGIMCNRQFATAAADIGEIGIISGAPDHTFKRKVVALG